MTWFRFPGIHLKWHCCLNYLCIQRNSYQVTYTKGLEVIPQEPAAPTLMLGLLLQPMGIRPRLKLSGVSPAGRRWTLFLPAEVCYFSPPTGSWSTWGTPTQIPAPPGLRLWLRKSLFSAWRTWFCFHSLWVSWPTGSSSERKKTKSPSSPKFKQCKWCCRDLSSSEFWSSGTFLAVQAAFCTWALVRSEPAGRGTGSLKHLGMNLGFCLIGRLCFRSFYVYTAL